MLLHDRDLFCIGTEMNANVIWMTHLYYREVLRGMGGGCRGGGGGSTGVVGGGGGEAVRGWLGVGGGGGAIRFIHTDIRSVLIESIYNHDAFK